MVELQRQMLAEKLGVTRPRLILGTSMGCMHAWVWMTAHPGAAGTAMPLACLPHPITGRNLVWRKMLVNSIRDDPAYRERFARHLMTMIMASNPQQLQIYQVESSWDYDPSADLEKIRTRVFAINFADDPINPPELGIFERTLRRVPRAKFLTMPGAPGAVRFNLLKAVLFTKPSQLYNDFTGASP
jgi:homoserine O-acetyltransferase